MSFNVLANVVDYSQKIEGFLPKLEFGGMMLVLGITTVFSVLIIIWMALILFKIAFHDIPAKKKQEALNSVKEEAPVVEYVDNTDEEIVAVIAAAIAMAESESDGIKFKVVSFRRI